MKLNNEQYYLTRNTSDENIIDKELSEVGVIDVFDHKQAIVYYESGAKEIEKYFKPEGYIKKGYVCSLLETKKQLSLYFTKYKGDRITELAGVHLDRNEIIGYEIKESSDLQFVKKEAIKHQSKYMFNRGAGILGSLTRLATEHMVSANIEIKNGYKFIISYKNKENNIEKLTLYTSEEHKTEIEYFLKRFK